MSLFQLLPLALFLEKLRIERIHISEVETLQEIGKTTFYETFASTNTAEDMAQYLQESFDLTKLKAELQQPNSEFYFAKIEGQPLAYLKVNWGNAQTEKQNTKALEIERIYVLQAYQKKQVGQALFEKALQIAREKDVNYIWLGVWENNLKALNFYKKHGFIPFDKHIFYLGNDAQTDIMMKLILK